MKSRTGRAKEPFTIQRFFASEDDEATALVDFVAQKLRLSKRSAKKIIDNKNVFVNGRRIWVAKYALEAGDKIEIQNTAGLSKQSALPLEILFEDEHYWVVNKPAGIPSVGSAGFEERIRQQEGFEDAIVAHRLDRDTSGCLVLAKSKKAFDFLKDVFREKQVDKKYLALVHGSPTKPTASIERPLDERTAKTHYELKAKGEEASLVELTIETGRKHQIRRHMASIGHPVIGDSEYSKRGQSILEKSAPRQMLHASAIRFINPLSGANVEAAAPPPDDFSALARKAGLA